MFLKENGFFPNSDLSGIFGYGTQSATRLFQEYVFSIEGDISIGTPDGIAGKNTLDHINHWKQNKLENLYAVFIENQTSLTSLFGSVLLKICSQLITNNQVKNECDLHKSFQQG